MSHSHSHSISELFLGLPDRGWPARHATDLMAHGQGETLFHLAAAKQVRSRLLAAHFAGRRVERVLISANLASFEHERPGGTVEFLDKGFFAEPDAQARERKIEHLHDAIVIVNNNDIGGGDGAVAFAEFTARCRHTVFVAWDWDNHHWLDQSTMLAALCDVYAPAHHENLYLLSRYNAILAGPVYCGSVQWSRRYLTAQLPHILAADRSDAPLGMHIAYGPFAFRNRVVGTLAQHFPSVGFSDRRFHARTADERLAEWTAHKAHWIVPVLNDVPIRIFDALITGGIPIIPESLRHLPPASGLDARDAVFYGPLDIVEPAAVVARANALFDAGGVDRQVARHRLALDHHHGDARIEQMLEVVRRQYGLCA
jgi:hypothetical protein